MSIETQLSLRQLRAFVAVYRLGKLATAASRLSVTESAVSTMLRQMESTLNLRLFDRTSRSLVPTQAAQEIVERAERILGDVAWLGTRMEDLGDRRIGRVHVAVTATVGSVLMPGVVRRFRDAYPGVQLVLDDCAPDQFLARVSSEPVDFGIGTPEREDALLVSRLLLRDHLCLVCATDHPLAGRRQVRWRELAKEPVIAVRQGLAYGMRGRMEAAAASAGIALNVVHEVNFLSSAFWMAASGLGVSIWASALAGRMHYENLTRCRLVGPRVPMDFSLVHKRGRSLSPAAEAFVEIARDELAGMDIL
ncbi:LysR family transcriptional regulator [Pigmentiphaga kullae]|uniref:DNA-binding transcriptional LysR family regulator n=1 Tax=Pigmentiphaga kullae TaxID=151784 RepID=A0A4V2F2N4_9BURK|nr:LysR family transcriptional regulator [Pigmentiphaga kullae]RZS78758.1 DNA-binding transcriptional LysR family regulator [Pigmentiphaga kullae]